MKTKAHTRRNAINQRIASRIRQGRRMRRITQRQLGEAIYVSAGQIHKIEKGFNQVSAGLLYQIARILEVPIVYFYRDICNPHSAVESRHVLTQLILNFSSIQNDKHRDAFSHLVRILADKENLPEKHVAATIASVEKTVDRH